MLGVAVNKISPHHIRGISSIDSDCLREEIARCNPLRILIVISGAIHQGIVSGVVPTAQIHVINILHGQDRNGQPDGKFDFIILDGMGCGEDIYSYLVHTENLLMERGTIAVTGYCHNGKGTLIQRAIFRFLHDRSSYCLFHVGCNSQSRLAILRHYPEGTKSYSINETYDSEFYKKCRDMHQVIIPPLAKVVYERFKPASVIDLGCGAGMWLDAFRNVGVRDVDGIDGSDAATYEAPVTSRIDIRRHDLRMKFNAPKKYDLCLCLDVIEHIEPEFEDNLIWSCVHASDTILFSSPTPGQGGAGHVNERPISHWVEKFFSYGYLFFDEIRPLLEGMPYQVEMTYHRNIYVVKKLLSQKQASSPSCLRFRDILVDKERRIEDLSLQRYAAREEIVRISKQVESLQEMRYDGGVLNFRIPNLSISLDEGHCFTYSFRTAAGQFFSQLPLYQAAVLYEDGKPLYQGKTLHDDIRLLGLGRYSMWRNNIYFSSSDNSDPRNNGRIYEFKVPSYIHLLENLPDDVVKKFCL